MAQSTTGEQQLIPVSLQLVAGATLIAGPSYELQALEMQPAGKILGDLVSKPPSDLSIRSPLRFDPSDSDYTSK